METQKKDLIIIGGGPAGMTAAIYAARAALDAVILESNITGGLVNSTYCVENFPSWKTIHGMDLMEKMREQVDNLSVDVQEVCEIESIDLSGEEKIVSTDTKVYAAPAVILATGRRPIPLETPNSSDNVHHCAICDGAPYAGKRVLVVGGGNSAFDEALYLLGIGVTHITLVEMMPRFFAAESTQKQFFDSGKTTAYTSTQVEDLVVEDSVLKGAVILHTDTGERQTIDVDGVFVFLGQKPNNDLFKDQIALTESGYIKADADMCTSVRGVFSAGDINDKHYRQITTAMADGTIAALSAERYLRDLRAGKQA